LEKKSNLGDPWLDSWYPDTSDSYENDKSETFQPIMEVNPTNIGYSIRSTRIGRNMTQREASDRIGITRYQLEKYELNQVKPGIDTLTEIALGLGAKELKIKL